MLKQQLIDILQRNIKAVSDDQLKNHFKDEYKRLPTIINELMKEDRLSIFQENGKLSYQLVSPEEVEKKKGLTAEHKLILQEIANAGNKGIWTRDIKLQTNIPQQIVTKTCQMLEKRFLIKSVKSINNKNKKLYMLEGLVPSREITGGPWYNDQEFDYGFIQAVSTLIYDKIKKSGQLSLNEITDQIMQSGISKIQLGPEEIMSILRTLIYDGKVEEVGTIAGISTLEAKYKISPILSTFNALTETPCGICPVFDECGEGNIISPESCIYMNKWLKLKDENIDF